MTDLLLSAAVERPGTGLSPRAWLNGRISALLATTALVAVAALLPGAAHAQDATWRATPATGDFNTGTNWSPATVPTGTAFFDTSSIISLSSSANTTIGGWTFNAGASAYSFTNGNVLKFTGAGIVINGGSATITNNVSGFLQFFNTSTAGSATVTVTNNWGLQFYDTSTAGSASITNNVVLNFNNTSTAGSASITNNNNNSFLYFYNTSTAGSASITNNAGGYLSFTNTSTAGSATITNNGRLYFIDTSTAGSATITTNAGGSTRFSNTSSGGNARFIANGSGAFDISGLATAGMTAGSIEGAGSYHLGSKQLTVGSNGLSTTVSGAISDGGTGGGTGGALVKTGTGTLTLSGTNTYTGGTTVTAGTLQLGNGGTTGSILGSIALTGGNFAVNRSNAVTLDGAISGSGSFSQIGAGNTILTAADTYTGATTINAGTLSVNGSILNSNVTVNAGGTLGGNGSVGNTTVNGGALAPGNSIGTPGTLNVNGSLMMTSAAAYVVFENAAAIGKTVVTGTAGIGGTATINLASTGGYHAGSFAILVANGGLTGTFSTVNVLGTLGPLVRNPHLMYDAHDVFLVLDPGTISPLLPANASANARALAAGFDAAILSGANPGGGFNALLNLTGVALTDALSQASGETATGSQQTTFDAMNQFMGLLTDPFIAGRGDGAIGGAAATPFAEEGDRANAYASASRKRASAERAAYAMFTKAPLAQSYDQRWSVWAAGFGGSQTTDGNVALGSNNTTSRVFGMAAGADYIFSPRTIAGFALAGGGTNFSVANSGTGRSDLFQAGAFIRHNVGPAYISGALAYGWQDITTDRIVTVGGVDRLRAQFNANAFSGRVEGGYRFVTPWLGGVGITPYAAGQFTTFDLPAYAEQVLSGANTFALAYGSRSVTDTRSELGVRTDKSWAMQNAILTLRGRLAWAHDFNPDRNIAATFQTLPGASFVVNGAAQASDSALTTASVEMKWMNGWSAAATFEGEFSNVTRSYAGKGVVRYSW